MRLKSKGTLGYIKNRKLARGAAVIIGAVLIIAIFLTGYITTKTRNNLLTIGAILAVLPTAKFAVLFIMLLPYHSQSKEAYDEVAAACKDRAQVLTETVLTTTEKVMPVDFFVIKDNCIIGYTANKKCDIPFTERFLSENMKQNGHKVTVKIWDDKKKFLSRISSLAAAESKDGQEERDREIAGTVLSLVL